MKNRYSIAALILTLAVLFYIPSWVTAADNTEPGGNQTYDKKQMQTDQQGMTGQEADQQQGVTGQGMDQQQGMTGTSEAQETIASAIEVFNQGSNEAAGAIPPSVLKDAAGIAIFPGRIKAALLAGGSYGSGVLLSRQDGDSWSDPLFVSLAGGSIGAQVGVESSDLILVFTNQDVLNQMAQGGDFTLGVDASVAAGDVGASASATTKEAQVLSYRSVSGLFAGASVDGSVLNVEEEPTIAYYNLSPAEGQQAQGQQQGQEQTARGYYGESADRELFDRIIGSKESMQNVPDSARRLKEAISSYISRISDNIQK